jgi:hypothetical protein
MTYDVTNDVFYAEQPYPSWTISMNYLELGLAQFLIHTMDNQYEWNEEDQTWDLVE